MELSYFIIMNAKPGEIPFTIIANKPQKARQKYLL